MPRYHLASHALGPLTRAYGGPFRARLRGSGHSRRQLPPSCLAGMGGRVLFLAFV